ncbi:MAG: AAA family ATPase [Xanthomonadaceae bacterium]|nr:AAA family ATPase [Xanthomonadaceae bacterium]
MPYERARHLLSRIQKASKLWPILGLLGSRQSGKTTLFTKLLGIPNSISLDDLETKNEANHSPKVFLSKLSKPLVIDEAQKAPPLFDAIKYDVDKNKRPGTYYLTGSSAFSSKIGVRESLTGRIGLFELHPMTLSELEQNAHKAQSFFVNKKSNYEIETFLKRMMYGGMPVPAFMRNQEERNSYWQSWLETTLYRDLAAFIPRSYDPDLAYSILSRMIKVFLDGELPTLKHFLQPARKVRQYLDAMSEIFLVKKFHCHETGVGKEVWYLFDSGLLAYLMRNTQSEGASLSLSRHFLMNELSAHHGFRGERFIRQYFKTARSGIVDFLIDDIPCKVVPSVSGITRQRGWEEKPLLSAMKHLKVKKGFLIGPTDTIDIPKSGIGVLPLHYFS